MACWVTINFAHGDLFMLGAFACLLLAVLLPVHLPFVVILLLATIVIGLLGAFIERVAYRPLRDAPRVSAIDHGPRLRARDREYHAQPEPLPAVHAGVFDSMTLSFGSLTITTLQILIIGVALGLMLGLDFLIRRTSFGMAMRAISFDARTVP